MIVLCNQCGVRFNKPSCHVSRVKTVFCSKACHDLSQVRGIQLVCPVCDKDFTVRPCEVKKYHTCSMQCARRYRRGENNPNWQGGVTGKRKKEMSRREYQTWRKAVLEREDYTCVDCGKCGGPLEVDHSKPWKDFPNLRYDIPNGTVRCKKCHTTRHTKHDGRCILVDFDGTLATWDIPWQDDYKATGKPIPMMVERIKRWLVEGEDVRIFTARMDGYHPKDGPIPAHVTRKIIENWCLKHVGAILPVTNRKEYSCLRIYDDRAIQVERDTGRLILEGGA